MIKNKSTVSFIVLAVLGVCIVAEVYAKAVLTPIRPPARPINSVNMVDVR